MTRRSPSLRTRVAVAAALGSAVVVVLVAVPAAVLLSRDQHAQLDRRLASVVEVLGPGDRAPRGWSVTVRAADGTVLRSTGPELAAPAPGYTTVPDGARDYRVLTTTVADGSVVSVGAPLAATRAAVAGLRRLVLALAVAAVALAAGLGRLFGGRALRPLDRLARGAATVGAGDGAGRVDGHGAREAEELAAAVNAMLARLQQAQAATAAARDTARDFAATAQHELRTPLTALRTDLEVLGLDPGEPERGRVVADLLRSQARVEQTLTALGQLAAGELAEAGGGAEVDLVELLHGCAAEALRTTPGLTVTVHDTGPVLLRGHPAGLRLAVDNLLRNAVHHGRATTVVLSASAVHPGRAVLCVDDDGAGVPEAERTVVFGRFVRGSTARGGGSGLGLALVAQQARLHGGSARLEPGPLGGSRAVLELAG